MRRWRMPLSRIPSLTRRGFLARSVAAISVSPFVFASPNHAKETTMTTDTEAVAVAHGPAKRQAAENSSIRSFSYRATDEELNDLRRRIKATRWPEKETVADTSQGVPLVPLQDLARYWATDYDWRKCEAKLNALPQFRARCPSSSRTDGPARSSSRSSWSARSPTPRPSA